MMEAGSGASHFGTGHDMHLSQLFVLELKGVAALLLAVDATKAELPLTPFPVLPLTPMLALPLNHPFELPLDLPLAPVLGYQAEHRSAPLLFFGLPSL